MHLSLKLLVLFLHYQPYDNSDLIVIIHSFPFPEYIYKKGGKDSEPPKEQDGFFFVPDDGRRKRPRKKNKFSLGGGTLSRTLF